MFRIGIVLMLLAGCEAAPTNQLTRQSAAVVSTQSANVNDYRRASGLGPLSQSSKLNAIAASHARDMDRNGFFSHTGSDGRFVGQRARASGYYYCRISENIAQGHDSETEVMNAWYNSPSHRKNMLNRDVTEYGIAREGDDQWVIVFGRPGCKNGRPAKG